MKTPQVAAIPGMTPLGLKPRNAEAQKWAESLAPNGALYFHHDDVNKCRAWLRSHGLKLEGAEGWISATHRGLISFNDGHYAACWRRSDVLPAADCKNVIVRAARQDDIDAAAWLLCEAIGVGTGDLSQHPGLAQAWPSMDLRGRLAHIGDWLQEEALSFIPEGA